MSTLFQRVGRSLTASTVVLVLFAATAMGVARIMSPPQTADLAIATRLAGFGGPSAGHSATRYFDPIAPCRTK